MITLFWTWNKIKTQETCPDFEPPLTQRVPCQLIDWLVPQKWHSPFPVFHGVIPVVYGPWLPQTLWTIWKMADPQTTKIKSPNSHGPTDRSLASLDGLTLPRWVTFLLCVSFCNRIRCLAAILLVSIYRSVKIGEGKKFKTISEELAKWSSLKNGQQHKRSMKCGFWRVRWFFEYGNGETREKWAGLIDQFICRVRPTWLLYADWSIFNRSILD